MENIRPYDDEKIIEHAAKFGGKKNLREVTVTTDDEEVTYHFLVKKPGRSVMQAVASYKEKNDVNGISKVMLGCVLEGDMQAVENDGAVYGELLKQIGKLSLKAKSEIKKL